MNRDVLQVVLDRRRFLQLAGLGLYQFLLVACGRRARLAQTPAATAPLPAAGTAPPPPSATPMPPPTPQPATPPPPSPTHAPEPTATPSPHSRIITSNEFIPERENIIETVVVLVNFSGRPERVFDLRPHWQKIFGKDDPIRQLNAYYDENFYGQLALRPVQTPAMGEKGYAEIELSGMPQDYNFGWLVGMETDNISEVNPEAVRKLILEIMARLVAAHPDIDYQDKFIFVVLNATGNEYGRGAAGFLPSTGKNPMYDLFIGDVSPADEQLFADPACFQTAGNGKIVGIIDAETYPFTRYFQERAQYAAHDQFIRGMAAFSTDAPLSCASHDILHGLRRKSAYADPPEGRARAVNCLYNLQLQSKWLVGTSEHGVCDRSINCTPYIGWWDPMADHLHPKKPREFFCSHPQGMSAFTKLRMGFIPDRCLALAREDDVTLKLAPLGSPQLPPPGSEAEVLVARVPLLPGVDKLAHIYLLLEYRRRVGSEKGEIHPDNFTIDPGYVVGDKRTDPGYNPENPAASRYINPPTVFVPDEGVLVYLVNKKMPEQPGLPYSDWRNFVLVLLNPAGNEQRLDLNQVALDAGEQMVVDFRTFYPDRGIPIMITVTVAARTNEYAQVRVQRQRLG